jgi:hypothetical protein
VPETGNDGEIFMIARITFLWIFLAFIEAGHCWVNYGGYFRHLRTDCSKHTPAAASKFMMSSAAQQGLIADDASTHKEWLPLIDFSTMTGKMFETTNHRWTRFAHSQNRGKHDNDPKYY